MVELVPIQCTVKNGINIELTGRQVRP